MSHPQPVIVLVHGAWHTPAIYSRFVSALSAAEFEVHCPQLPTCSDSRPPKGSFEDDVNTVRELLESLVKASKQVIMVMHSYGGAVGTEASNDLSLTFRSSRGLPGGVVHLIYMCAYILPVGGTMAQVVNEAGYSDMLDQVLDIADDGSCFPRDPTQMLLGGVDAQEVRQTLPLFVRFNISAMTSATKFAGWQYIPATYLYSSEDYSVPRLYQEIMTKKVKALGIPLLEEYYDSSHSLFLTKTEEMVNAVQRACGHL